MLFDEKNRARNFVKTQPTYGPFGQVVGTRHERQRLRDQDQVN